ncbi:nuclear envelope integral membrane protein 2-like isoform X2 [Arabidopsis lyrata subsp. lyrata]|uniref:nuclear envelope integral membrane protein 2-like isoform X2 n=1 Tax=Arabidopsis lyrata subsp. lyrata TaxID=81972 RepID=UPI000A29BFE1|nr:nuclear envelope integral membrane protein 2-like isoform X2 [Arabidopsis lyrata subsp. lyrata]|eukprot:XP_020875329.1 nuclear envelope integral membrane protein 2-like isoform X2 [Arabidopsis lyrata subsp. lyrata]
MGNYLLLHVIVITFAFSSLVSGAQLLVTPRLEVKGSPGSLCDRILIHGIPRLTRIDMYAHSLKLIVNASSDGETHVCFHSDFSLALGMCPHNQWKKVSNGSWTQKMSPFFYYKLLDVRVASSSEVTLKVSTVKEWLMYRYVFLILGTILLTYASTLSRSYAFYYVTTFSVGLIPVGLLLCFQVVKHARSRRLEFFLYRFLVCLCYVIGPYIPSFTQSMLRVMGFREGFYKPVLYVWVPSLYMWGILCGLFAINSQLLLTQDGSIDVSTSLFISWAIWIFAAVLILLSSWDPMLAWGALIVVIVMSRMFRTITGLIFPMTHTRVSCNLFNISCRRSRKNICLELESDKLNHVSIV